MTIYLELSANTDIVISSVFIYKVGFYWNSSFSVFPSLGGQYFTVHSLGTISHSILPRANNGNSVYWEIHLSKRAILKEFNFNIPFLRIIYGAICSVQCTLFSVQCTLFSAYFTVYIALYSVNCTE